MMTVTIKDVANRAGVSPAAVSRALNKSGYVSAENVRRVEQAAAALGYQPNWMARGPVSYTHLDVYKRQG